MTKLIIFLFTISVGPLYAASEREVREEVEESLRSGDYQFFEGQKTNIRNPFQMRDPFRREIPRQEKGISERLRAGFDFTNMPSIDNVPVERIRITGVLLGESRRAVAKIVQRQTGDDRGDEVLSDESFILSEGMTLGQYDAEIKAILPGGVVLVEQILNVYDQLEYIETILPVRPER